MAAPPPLPTTPKRARVHITWQLVLGWLAAAAVAIPGILPVLPPELVHAAPWLKPSLMLAAVIIGAILRSPATAPADVVNAELAAARASVPPRTIRGDVPIPPLVVAVPVPVTAPRPARSTENAATLDGEEADTNPGGIPPRAS